MTSQAFAPARRSIRSTPLTGFGNVAWKDLREWIWSWRALTMTFVATALVTFGVLVERIRQAAGDTTGAPIVLDPTTNLGSVGWETLVPLFAAFGTMALIAGERDRGTLSWSLSMPLSRSALLLSKLVTGVLMIGVTCVVIPDLVGSVAARAAYGSFPAASAWFWIPLGGFAVAAFLVALNVAASTFVRGQGGVVGVTLVTILAIPPIVGMLSHDLEKLLPTSIGSYVMDLGAGKAVDPARLGIYAGSFIALAVLARYRLSRQEL